MLRTMAIVSQSQYATEGAAVRDLRDRAGYSLRGLARELGVSAPHLSRIERGLRQPGNALRKRIELKFGVPLERIASSDWASSRAA